MKRDNIESYRLPFTIDEVLSELSMHIWCTASQVALLGRDDLACAMTDPDAEFGMDEAPAAHLAKIKLDAYSITKTVKDAYAFAFQVTDPERFGADDWADLGAFVSGGVRHSWTGDFSPTYRDESKLRHVADMVTGRVELLTDGALSIRQLALLANMIEPAVRSSLSTEGIKTEGRPASLPAATALAWLRKRRGFVPTSDGLAVQHLASNSAVLDAKSFPDALVYMIGSGEEARADLAAKAGVNPSMLERLIGGSERNAGIQDLVRLAKALLVEPQPFIDAYVKFVSQ